MAIAFDAHSSGKGATASLTVSHTCTGADLGLWVGFACEDDTETVTSVTYDGAPLTAKSTNSNPGNCKAWSYYLEDPAAGTADVVITKSGAGAIVAHVVSFTGCDTDKHNTGNNGTGTAVLVTRACPTNRTMADLLAANNGGGALTATPGAGQTGWDDTQGNLLGAASYKAGSVSANMAWTLSASVPWADELDEWSQAPQAVAGAAALTVSVAATAAATVLGTTGAREDVEIDIAPDAEDVEMEP